MTPHACVPATRIAGAVAAVAVALVSVSQAAGRTAGPAARCEHHRGAPAFLSYEPAFRMYDDDIEDSGNAPDFCASEFVTNDNETLTIGIHAHNRSGLMAGDSYGVLLDTDSDAATGEGGSGAEYELTLDELGTQLKRWDGTGFVPASATPLPMEWIDGYGPLLGLERTAIGDPAGVNVVFVSANGAEGDRAPDAGSWTYSLSPFALMVKPLALGRAQAGRPFVARAVVLRSDFDDALTEGAIRCPAKLAGRALAGTGRFAGSRVTCTWRLPKGAHGKRLSGRVSAAFQGAEASRAFSVRVR